MVALNRLTATKMALISQDKAANKSVRRARTRTLIQLGALVKMVGFLPICGIEEGMDLQLNMEHRDKAAVLLGILVEAFEALPAEIGEAELECWKAIGIQKLKRHQAENFYLK